MASINSKTDEENQLPTRNDSYRNGVGAVDSDETGIGGTTSASETFDRIGSAASEFNDNRIEPSDGNINIQNDLPAEIVNDNSPLKWIIPLILLVLLVALGSWFCGKSPAANTANTGVTIANSNANSAAAVNANK